MLNYYIIKVNLKNGETRYRTILTKSGKGIKTKTFRRKQDARIWGSRAVLDSQEYEAKGIKPCTIKFNRLADEYIQWWTGKDHDRVKTGFILGKTLRQYSPFRYYARTYPGLTQAKKITSTCNLQ
jgi:hypothetical protein